MMLYDLGKIYSQDETMAEMETGFCIDGQKESYIDIRL